MIIRDVKQRWNKGIYWMSKSKPWLGCRYFLGAPTIPLVMDVLGSWSSFVLTWMGLYTYAFTSVCMCVLFLCRHDESWETYSILNWVLFCLPWEKYGGIHICFVFPYYNASSKWHCVYFNKHNVLIHVYTCISYIYIYYNFFYCYCCYCCYCYVVFLMSGPMDPAIPSRSIALGISQGSPGDRGAACWCPCLRSQAWRNEGQARAPGLYPMCM